MSSRPVIELHNVSIYHGVEPFKSYSAKELRRSGELILSNIDLQVQPGEFVYLIGRVGSGKSALLKTLYAELKLVEGEAHVAGYNLSSLRRRDIPFLRRRMGIVFQDYQLLGDRNIYMNLHFVMRATGWRKEELIRQRIDEVLSLVGLETKGYKMPFELSGGEQQRLVIARALLNSPKLILADEPTGNLDPVTTNGIMKLFYKISQQGCAVVMSTHNTSIIDDFPARTLLLSKGGLREVQLSAK
ncbi:MAG: ATP-binding cassette domain-containing protein [Rikenellaceae bacterium]